MAAEDNKVILNPYSPLSDTEKKAVGQNEALRLYMREHDIDPAIQLNPQQEAFFKGTPYENAAVEKKQTVLARILSGDPSVTATPEQQQYANALLQQVQGRQTDPNDYTEHFNTPLTTQEERAFRKWAGPRVKDLYDYDLRGFWKSGAAFDERGHGADRFKKPNHPTFSDQSMYHEAGAEGGNWGVTDQGQTMFTPSVHNLTNMPLPEMKRYFNAVEPEALINISPEAIQDTNE